MDAVGPVTLYKTSHTGLLPTAAVGLSQVKTTVWSLTTYPNGATVTNIQHYTVTLYDQSARTKQYGQPNQIDLKA